MFRRLRVDGVVFSWAAGLAALLLRESTIADYTWQLSNHLLPFFHRHRLPQITVAEVDRPQPGPHQHAQPQAQDKA